MNPDFALSIIGSFWPETISGFIDFIVAPTLGVCGDVISLVAGRYFNFALQSLTLYLGEAIAWRLAKSDFESQHLLSDTITLSSYLPCVILWLLILSEDTRRSPGRRTWQWTRTCGKRRYKSLKKHKAISRTRRKHIEEEILKSSLRRRTQGTPELRSQTLRKTRNHRDLRRPPSPW